jgi:Putative prokaryotic signal transducing protein
MSGEPTVIYSAASPQQAYLLKGLLEERGIAAWVVNDAMQIAGGELPLGWTAAAKVVVGLADANDGRQLAEEFDRRTAEGSVGDEPAIEAEAKEWADWPVCPECSERRAARCPVCESSANDFPLADLQATPDGERILLFCSSCDDHFLPQWYRLCARCGHDFGSGVLIDADRHPRQWDLRSMLVIAAMLAGVAAFAAYFLWLFAARSI